MCIYILQNRCERGTAVVRTALQLHSKFLNTTNKTVTWSQITASPTGGHLCTPFMFILVYSCRIQYDISFFVPFFFFCISHLGPCKSASCQEMQQMLSSNTRAVCSLWFQPAAASPLSILSYITLCFDLLWNSIINPWIAIIRQDQRDLLKGKLCWLFDFLYTWHSAICWSHTCRSLLEKSSFFFFNFRCQIWEPQESLQISFMLSWRNMHVQTHWWGKWY